MENTLWSNTVLASTGHVVCQIVYTGKETRAEMNQKPAQQKIGKLDLEINRLSKLLLLFMFALALGIVGL